MRRIEIAFKINFFSNFYRCIWGQTSRILSSNLYPCMLWEHLSSVLLSNLYLYIFENSREFFSCPWNANIIWERSLSSFSSLSRTLSLEWFNFQIRLPVEKRRQKQKKTYRSLVFSVLNFITSNGNFASKIRLTRSSTPFYIDNTPKYINLSFSPVTNARLTFASVPSLSIPPLHTHMYLAIKIRPPTVFLSSSSSFSSPFISICCFVENSRVRPRYNSTTYVRFFDRY